jgi:hypothetical protein
MICIDCHTAETGSTRRKRCDSCKDAREQMLIKASNDRLQQRRLAKRQGDPRICQEPKCTNPVEGLFRKCKPCRERHNQRVAEHRDRVKPKAAKVVEEQITPSPPWVPRPKPPPLMTDAEQRRIDRETASRMFGDYRHSPVRLYTAQEIANYARGM